MGVHYDCVRLDTDWRGQPVCKVWAEDTDSELISVKPQPVSSVHISSAQANEIAVEVVLCIIMAWGFRFIGDLLEEK